MLKNGSKKMEKIDELRINKREQTHNKNQIKTSEISRKPPQSNKHE